EEMEEEDQEVLKSINETPAQKAAKKRKLNEEAQEVEDLKKRLEVVDDEDDDVFTEATLLARKGIAKERFSTSKPSNFSDEYLLTTLKIMFEKPDEQDDVWKNQRSVHDLENLWGIVKERFSTSKPTNFSNEYLLLTLKTMFEKPDEQDDVWKNQRSVHGLALLLELMLSKNSRKNTKCVNAANEELTTAKHELMLL
nr:hypothetical protein [Tanacetum cinerariifolium]